MKTIADGKKFSHLLFLFSFALLLIVQLLIFEIKIGLIAFAGLVLFSTVLIKPKYIFLLLISLFSFEGFSALQNLSYPKIIGILLMIGLVARIAITKEAIPKDDAYKYFLLFFIGSLVSFAFAKNPSISISIYITYFSLFILYICTRYFLRNTEDINRALNYLFLSTLIIFAIVQGVGLSVSELYISRISGGIGDPNEFASYLLVLIPLVFYRVMGSSGILKISYWGCLFSFFVILLFTGSRGGILGFLGMTMVFVYHYSIKRTRQLLFFILVMVTILYFFVPKDFWIRTSTIVNPEAEEGSSIETREYNYQAALKMFLDYPLAGVGLSNFKFNSKDYGGVAETVVHNTYLEILTGGGLLSFVPFLLILINCWKKLKIKEDYDKNIRDLLICLKASFVSILITSFFISGDHKKILWFLFALISSSYCITVSQKRLYKIGTLR